MRESEFFDEHLALRSFATSGSSYDEEDFGILEDDSVDVLLDFGEDFVGVPLGVDGDQLPFFCVIFGNWRRRVVERGQPGRDRF